MHGHIVSSGRSTNLFNFNVVGTIQQCIDLIVVALQLDFVVHEPLGKHLFESVGVHLFDLGSIHHLLVIDLLFGA
ncbi:transcription initiation factor TFIID subunit 7 [Pyrenophora tritici-repentis]|nr:Transcription initiation factor TFIID subunit 7 [Pyrenophora tritici-repentis]KAG9382149.1 Transcription initiation factor TFIID protein [Pyrenophora tritici-repentis]KAI1530577.1 transcription initiation factor TFIID subunit 7 [Pyrenophora tritici-repentis]KAI1532311.1 transcription initiation factor TFIID subunit 7 [Pyrenophora tritici-repentis]KAI1542451.1 transcription initiation factor TFIID subunit 7 [Pyrenophora tritici-repentis]